MDMWESDGVTPDDVIAIEAEARAAARKEVLDEIDREMPDEWTPWESDKADEAFGYNDALRRVRIILDSLSTDTREEPTDA